MATEGHGQVQEIRASEFSLGEKILLLWVCSLNSRNTERDPRGGAGLHKNHYLYG